MRQYPIHKDVENRYQECGWISVTGSEYTHTYTDEETGEVKTIEYVIMCAPEKSQRPQRYNI